MMTPIPLATYLVVPLHFFAGALFSLIPSSVYHPAYYGAYSMIALTLVGTVVSYGWLLRNQPPLLPVIWLQCFLALLAAAVPFFTFSFDAVWYLIMYPLFMLGSIFACMVVAHVVVLTARP